MKNAEIIAKFLNDHPKVSYVLAGFENNSYHHLAKSILMISVRCLLFH